MRARDQCSIFSTSGKFRSDYGLLLEFHGLTLVARFNPLLDIVTVIYHWVPRLFTRRPWEQRN